MHGIFCPLSGRNKAFPDRNKVALSPVIIFANKHILLQRRFIDFVFSCIAIWRKMMRLRNEFSLWKERYVLPASVEERSISSPLSFLCLPCSEPRLCWPGPVEAIPPRLGKRFGSTQRAAGGGRQRGSEPLWKNLQFNIICVLFWWSLAVPLVGW